jgi:hypothetical protein
MAPQWMASSSTSRTARQNKPKKHVSMCLRSGQSRRYFCPPLVWCGTSSSQ